MTPEQESYRQTAKMVSRANQGVERAFAIFMALTAGRTPPDEAIRATEEAMEVWTPYEDRNRMEMPEFPLPANPATVPLPIVAYAVARRATPFHTEIHAGADRRLAVFESQGDAEKCAKKLGRTWGVLEVGARFNDASTLNNPPAALPSSVNRSQQDQPTKKERA